MCKSPLHPFLAALPKCEHHLHIEGTLEPSLLFTLASKNSITLPPSDPAFTSPSTLSARYSQFTSLDDFLHYYFIGMTTLLTGLDFHALAVAYFQRAHADGVRHAEIFFDPQAHTARGVPYSTVVSGLESACAYASQTLHMSTALIPCILRHLPLASAEASFAELLPDLQSRRLTGLGLSSTELEYPPHLFKSIFTHPAILDAEGPEGGRIHTTSHAGEEGPVAYMASALHDLRVQRVDHGIKLLDDPALLDEFVKSKTLITICPISNLSLRAAPRISALPIRKYLEAGVRFSINSDDPAYFGVTAPHVDEESGEEVDGVGSYILSNYCAVQEAFDFSVEEWGRICRNAIEGSWCGKGRKGELLGMLEECLGGFKKGAVS